MKPPQRLGLDGPRIESRWGESFRTCPDQLWSPASLLHNGHRVFPGGKERPGCNVDPSPSPPPPSSAVVPLWAVRPIQSLSACTRGTGSFPGVRSGRGVKLTPHPLLVPWSRKSRAKLLLPLWSVRPVQSLSACTSVHLYLTFKCTVWVERRTSECKTWWHVYKPQSFTELVCHSCVLTSH